MPTQPEVLTPAARSRLLRRQLDSRVYHTAHHAPIPLRAHAVRQVVASLACPPSLETHLLTGPVAGLAALVALLVLGPDRTGLGIGSSVVAAVAAGVVVAVVVRLAQTARLLRRRTRAAWLARRAWTSACRIRRAGAPLVVRSAVMTMLVEIERARVAVDQPYGSRLLTSRLGGREDRWRTVEGTEAPDVLESLLINDVALLADVAERTEKGQLWRRRPGDTPTTGPGAWQVLQRREDG